MSTDTLTAVLQCLSGIAFIAYGFGCLVLGAMEVEFARYGLRPFLRWIGLLEILGGMGLVIGFFWTPLIVVSSLGLTILMGFAVWARWRIKDPWLKSGPAASLGVINLFILVETLKSGGA